MEDSMKQLAESLAKQLSAGLPETALRTMVMSQGWSEGDFYRALTLAKQSIAKTAPVAASPTPMPSVPSMGAAPVSGPVSIPVAAPTVTPSFTPAPAPVSAPVAAPAPLQTPAAAAMISSMPSAMKAPMTVPTENTQPVMAPVVGKKSHTLLFLISIIILLGLVGGAAYAYVQKIGPFAKAPYGQDNLVSGLLMKSAQIKAASYAISGSVFVEPRDEGAKPFDIKITDDQALKEKYARDYTRGDHMKSILQASLYPSYSSGYSSGDAATSSLRDPLTGAPYLFSVTPDGKDFSLTMTFETPDAIATIRDRSGYLLDNSTRIDGQTVTFSKLSPQYVYFASRPPQTFFEELRDFAAMIPPELNVKAGTSASSNWSSTSSSTDWIINVDGSGDFGDLTYKVNVDARKKDSNYYLRINNLPSLFLSSYLPPKGQWVTVTSTSSALSGFIPQEISGTEDSFVSQKNAVVALVKKVAQFADEEKLLTIKNAPTKEKVGERSLYRYNLALNKASILPFYKKVVAEATDAKNNLFDAFTQDQALVNYLESAEFSQVFDYLNDNLTITLWVDDAGYPASMEYAVRIVPPAGTSQLEGKQAKLVLKVDLSDINKPVEVSVPEGSKPLDEVMSQAVSSLTDARMKGQIAALKSNMAMIRPSAEIAYDTTNSYGKKAFPLGPCLATKDTIFADTNVFNGITAAAGYLATTSTASSSVSMLATCVSELKNGSVQSYAVSVPLPDSSGYSFCIDSTGASKEVYGKLQKASCASVSSGTTTSAGSL